MLNRIAPGLSRQVIAFYLLFTLLAVGWLAVGTIILSQVVLREHADRLATELLSQASASAALAHIRHDPQQLQKTVDRLQYTAGAVYCAVYDDKGVCLAHSHPERIGHTAGAAEGKGLRIRSVPLRVNGRRVGTLQLAMRQPPLGQVVLATATRTPWALLAPLMVVAAGLLIIHRLLRAFRTVHDCLVEAAAAPPVESLALAPIEARTVLELGWNRIVEELEELRRAADLRGHLDRLVDARPSGHLEEALDSLTEGLLLTDVEGRITFASRAVAAMLAGDDQAMELVGADLASVLGGTVPDSPDSSLLAHEALDRPAVAELRRPRPQGERIIRAARSPVRRNGRPLGQAWSLRDITQQKLADQMRDQFLDAATHELRTPLANIKAYAETLALNEQLDIEKQKEFCNIINAEATRLARFIDDMLDLSSIEVGTLSIARQNVESARMLEEVVEKVRPQMERKQIDFQVAFSAKLPELLLDKDKVMAALVNLLGNAAKYTPEGGRVDFRAMVRDNRLHIEVEDSGYGIAPDELPRVFDKFFRSADPRVRSESGTGLGLALAKEVIELHGGQLNVCSEIDKGTIFTLTLPLALR